MLLANCTIASNFENNSSNEVFFSRLFFFCFLNNCTQEEYTSLQKLSYPETSVFMVVISVIMPESMRNAEIKWIPEIRQVMPQTPFLVVGTQVDLRNDEATRMKLGKRRQKVLMPEDCELFASRVGARAYVECSSLTRHGLKDVFDEAILAVLEPRDVKPEHRRRKLSCIIL